MPLLFIVCGTLLLCNFFGVIKYSSAFKQAIFSFSCSLILIGYFFGGVFWSVIHFNIFALIVCLIAFGVLFVSKKIHLSDIIITAVVGVVYYYLLNFDLSYMVGYGNDWVVPLLIFAIGLFSINLTNGFSLVLLISTTILLVSVYCGYGNFGVIDIDFKFVFEMSAIYYLSYFIKTCLIKLVTMKRERSLYVEKGWFYLNSYNFGYVLF